MMPPTPPDPRPPLTFIVAVARNGVMGKDGKLPWDLPEDRAFFRDTTMSHAVIMGRRTWDERGAPLDGRRNIVVSRSGRVSGAGREVVATIEDAIALARATDPDPFVVGGAEIFKVALPYATKILLTEIDFPAEGDTFFPPLDPTVWRAAARHRGDRATYVTYERAGP
jgi:dihydrofolate reductase